MINGKSFSSKPGSGNGSCLHVSCSFLLSISLTSSKSLIKKIIFVTQVAKIFFSEYSIMHYGDHSLSRIDSYFGLYETRLSKVQDS